MNNEKRLTEIFDNLENYNLSEMNLISEEVKPMKGKLATIVKQSLKFSIESERASKIWS